MALKLGKMVLQILRIPLIPEERFLTSAIDHVYCIIYSFLLILIAYRYNDSMYHIKARVLKVGDP